MSLLVWNPEWDTGIALIDAQHRILLGQVDVLMTAMHENDVDRHMPSLLAFLADYVDEHFQMEEERMAATGYPGIEGHRAIHDGMRRDVASLVERFEVNSQTLNEEVLDFLMDWLVKHINGEDRRLARHLHQWADANPRTQP